MKSVARAMWRGAAIAAVSCAAACSGQRAPRPTGIAVAPSSASPASSSTGARAEIPPSASFALVSVAPSASAPADAPDPAPPSDEPATLAVPGDKAVYVLAGAPGLDRVFVYLHGKCGDPLAFRAFTPVVRRYGTLVSLVGDVPCGDGARARWSMDTKALDARVGRALDAVEAARGAPLDRSHIVAMGYSLGALRAEALATEFPERYRRAILIAGPRPPKPGGLVKAERVLVMAGELDIWMPLAEAAKDLTKSGQTARFIEIPGAHHGDYGPKAHETMDAAFAWITE